MIDVAVAGGGPAGSAVAALLARDHGVTVFEDHPRIGLPEQCAGLLTDRAIEASGVSPDVLSTLYGAEVLLPGGGRVEVRSERPKARAVDRSDLDSKMADRAMAAGAEYRLSEKVRSFSVGPSVTISTSAGDHGARLLVGADGHGSVVAPVVGCVPGERIRGVQADVAVRVEDQGMFRMRMGSRYAPGFFTWEIPCGDFTRVGLCTSWSAGPPYPYLKRLLSDLGYDDRVIRMHSGRIPMHPSGPISADRTMLIGDAASQVKPVSGGGILPSMVAAPILADVAHSALASDDLSARRLSEYDRRWDDAMGRDLSKAYRLRRALLRMDDRDLDRAGRYASRDDVRAVLDGIDLDTPADVMKALLRHPGMAASGAWTLLRCLI